MKAWRCWIGIPRSGREKRVRISHLLVQDKDNSSITSAYSLALCIFRLFLVGLCLWVSVFAGQPGISDPLLAPFSVLSVCGVILLSLSPFFPLLSSCPFLLCFFLCVWVSLFISFHLWTLSTSASLSPPVIYLPLRCLPGKPSHSTKPFSSSQGNKAQAGKIHPNPEPQ